MTVTEADIEDLSEEGEVLTADLPSLRLRQRSSYANPLLSGNISNWKRTSFHCERTEPPKYPSNLCPDEGTSHLFWPCKEMEMWIHWRLEWMPALHCTAVIWRLHSPWHLLLAASFGLQLEHHSVTSPARLDLLNNLKIKELTERLMPVCVFQCDFYVLSCHCNPMRFITSDILHEGSTNTPSLNVVGTIIFCSVSWPNDQLYEVNKDKTCLHVEPSGGSIGANYNQRFKL